MRHLLHRSTALQLLLFFFVFTWGCKKDFTIGHDESRPRHYPISLQEAKDWFANRPVVTSFGEADEKIIVPLQPAWEKALIGHAQSGREIITIPLERDSLIKKVYGNQVNVVMLVSKDSTEVIDGQLLLYHADSAYFAAHSNNLSLNDFSGEFLFFDLDYNYQYGFVTENGVPVERIDTVTVKTVDKQELEDRADPTIDCIAYSVLNVYCWTIRECCPFGDVDCVIWVETFVNCETIGGGGPGGGGGSGGGGITSGGGSGGSGGTGGNGGTPPPTFIQILTNGIPIDVFIINGGVLPPGFTPELAKQLQQFYAEYGLTPDEYIHVLANPNLIPILMDFCTVYPPPVNNGTIQGTTQGNSYPPNDETQLCPYLQDLAFKCHLNAEQGKWLANSTEDIFQMHNFLDSHQWDEASVKAMQWYAKANAEGVFPHFTVDDHIVDPSLIAEFVVNATIYRTECQNQNGGQPCSDWEVYSVASYRTLIGYVHTGLDICGMIPGGGEPCDLVNGVIYTFEGDLMNAGLSFSSSLPIAGWFVTGAKYAGITFVVGNIAHTLQFKKVGNLIDFGDRGLLRKVLGLTDANYDAHHIVPWALRENELVQHAAKGRYHMNHFDNGIELEKYRVATGAGTHANHPEYNIKVEAKMNELWQRLQNHYGAGAVPVEVARIKLIELENSIRNHIISNPTVKINDLPLNGVNVPTVP